MVKVAFLYLTVIVFVNGWSTTTTTTSRRRMLQNLIVAPLVVAVPPVPAIARNLPESTGADLSKIGTKTTLKPVLEMKVALLQAERALSSDDNNIQQIQQQQILFQKLPKNEKEFKRIFDEYSDPVSYKQTFLDQNAFLVYYTKGFDGIDRPNIESDVPEKQTLQYGARNDCWVAWESFRTELEFSIQNPKDASTPGELRELCRATLDALEKYLSLAPKQDVEEIMRQLR
mmetsp:Transcript_173/g.206  ORF Transcript_173/g.206 Transcript_173/m.206 type:complete len:230 (+) Transcript_173:87-776(+)